MTQKPTKEAFRPETLQTWQFAFAVSQGQHPVAGMAGLVILEGQFRANQGAWRPIWTTNSHLRNWWFNTSMANPPWWPT